MMRRGLLWCLNLLFLGFFLFPFYWQTVTALKTPAEADALPVSWFPHQLFWGNVGAVLADPGFTRAVVNSVLVATTTTALALTVAASAAYALTHLPLPHPRSMLMGILIAATIPPIALVPSLYLLLRQLQWLDTYRALIAADLAIALPIAIWVLGNAFREIPVYLVQQAEVDGWTPAQALRHVVVPLAAPGVTAAGLLIFIMVWNEFLFAVTFTLHPEMQTVSVAIQAAGGWGGRLAAASQVVTVPIIALVLLGQRRIVHDLTNGSVKGWEQHIRADGVQVDPLIEWRLTYVVNFTGHPAASSPAGLAEGQLPVGMQIIGRRYADADVLAASATFERLRPWQDSYQLCAARSLAPGVTATPG